jgi:hypothetical protein
MRREDLRRSSQVRSLGNSRQPSVNSPSDRFGNAVGRMCLLPSLPDQNDSRLILYDLAYRLPAQPPSLRQFSDPKMLLSESFSVNGAWVIDNRAEMKRVLYQLVVKRCAHRCLSSECPRSGRRGDLELNPVFSQICADVFGDCNVLTFD